MVKRFDVLKTVFPSVVTDNFDFVSIEESDSRLDYWLDEKEWLEREDYKLGTIRCHGFTGSVQKVCWDTFLN